MAEPTITEEEREYAPSHLSDEELIAMKEKYNMSIEDIFLRGDEDEPYWWSTDCNKDDVIKCLKLDFGMEEIDARKLVNGDANGIYNNGASYRSHSYYVADKIATAFGIIKENGEATVAANQESTTEA